MLSDKLDFDLLGEFLDKSALTLTNISLNQFLELPTSRIKGISEDDLINLEKILNIKTIQDLNNLHYKTLVINKNKITNYIENIDRILNWKRKISGIVDINSKQKKNIIFLGIDNAGKTTIINVFKKHLKIEDLTKIKPTIGINREQLFLKRFNINILDLGGQKKYRDEHIKNPERYFSSIAIAFFVIDITDDKRYDEVLTYLKDISEIIMKYNDKQNCSFIVLIHKFDPEIINDIIYNEKYEYLTEEIEKILSNKFDFKILKSSIYNLTYSPEEFLNRFNSFFAIGSTIDMQVKTIIEKMNELEKELDSMKSKTLSIKPRSKISTKKSTKNSDDNSLLKSKSSEPAELKSELINELKGLFEVKFKDRNI